MATITHAHAKHPPRQQENVVPVHSMSSTSDDHLPSYLPEDELDAFQETIPSNSQEHLLHLANPEHFTSSEEYGDLYRSSSNSSNKKVLQPGSLSSRYPSYLPESDEDTELDRHLSRSVREHDINYQSHLSGNAKLHARSGRHPSVRTETGKPLNGVKKSYMKQVTQGEDRNSHLYSGLGSLSSCLSNSIEDKVHVSAQKTATGPVHEEEQPSSHRGSSIHESVGRLSLTQRTLSGDSVDSCQSAKTAFAQELGEASREKSLTKANSKNSHKDQLALSVNECLEGLTGALRNSPRSSEGAAKTSPWQEDQMPNNTGQQTSMQTHINTPGPTDIPVTSLPTDSSSSAENSESCSGNLGQSLGPTSGWSFHLHGNGMRMEVPKSKSSYGTGVKDEEKSQQDRSMLRSLFSSQVTSHLSEEELVKEAKMTALEALTRIVQEKPIFLDSDPVSLLSQLSDLICQNQENEPASRNSFAPSSLRSTVSQSLGLIEDMLSTTSTIAGSIQDMLSTTSTTAGNHPGAMPSSGNQHQEQNPASQSGHSMTSQLLSTIFISQTTATAARTNEQNELLTTLQSATARLSLVQEKIQSDKVGEVMKNVQESQQHRHARIMDILERLCPESLKQVLVSAAYCYGKCKEPNCMLAHEVLSYLVECVKEGTVLRCRGCCPVLSHLLHHHVPRCTERRCPVPYCVHLQTGTPSSVEEAVRRINAEIGSMGLYPEIVVRTSDPSFQGLAMAHPGVEKLEPVLPLGAFGRNILAIAKDKYVTIKQMDRECLEVLRRLDGSTPHIVQFFWVQSAVNRQEELQVCAAFEQGGSLQNLLADYGGLKTDRIWMHLQQVLQAVIYLHNLDIVYLAWTADNIVLDSSHQMAKLSNLSYAVHLTEETTEDACVQAVTGLPPQILAPEVHADLLAYHQSDIWGLGCLLFQLRVGRLPYPHLSHDHPESIRQKIGEDRELPRIPQSWQGQERKVLEACWQEEATSRPSAQQLQALVNRYC